jgi:hypothetical protein
MNQIYGGNTDNRIHRHGYADKILSRLDIDPTLKKISMVFIVK